MAQCGGDWGHDTAHILTRLFTVSHFHGAHTTILPSYCQSCAHCENIAPHVMLRVDPCSALFVSTLPSARRIFSSLFMSQCKLIHVDSVLKRSAVGGLLRPCGLVYTSHRGVSPENSWRRCVWCKCGRLPEEPGHYCSQITAAVNLLTSVGWCCHDTLHNMQVQWKVCAEKSILSWLPAQFFFCQLHSEMPKDSNAI